jgi:transposase
MKIVGCDLHARQQTIAMVDTETGEFTEKTLSHEGNAVRAFYAALEGSVVVGIEATGSMQWFLELLEELGIQCRVGYPAEIPAKETRKQRHDRRDARLISELLGADTMASASRSHAWEQPRPRRAEVGRISIGEHA